jgi:hypothetical protein
MRVSLRLVGLTTLAFAALAASPTAGQAQGRQVVGTYTTVVNSPQGGVKAVIVLKKENGTLGGTLAADGFPTLPLSLVTPSDTGVTIQAETPDGGVAVAMKFGAANKVTGTVVYQGAEMGFEGTFEPEGSAGAAAGTPMNPTGEYNLKASEPLMGQADFPVQCTISRSATGTLGGTCGNEQGAAPVGSVTVAGNEVTMIGESPIGPFKVVVTVSGAMANGTITIGTESSKAKGSFTAK